MKKPTVLLVAALLSGVSLLAGGPTASAQTSTVANADSIAAITRANDYSFEFDAPVLRLYQAFFDRAPDVTGAKYWLDVRRQGYDALDIAGFMSAGEEFANTYRGTNNARFTELVYRNVLGRNFDQPGYEYWLRLLNQGPRRNGLDRPGMVFFVTANQEFKKEFQFGVPTTSTGSGFGNGVYTVGDQVKPGLYVSSNPSSRSPGCAWERRSGRAGSVGTIASRVNPGAKQVVVELLPADVSFESTGCGTFTPATDIQLDSVDRVSPGDWLVGTQVAPGFYSTDGPIDTRRPCSYQRMSSFEHVEADAIDMDQQDNAITIQIESTDVGFHTSNCRAWVRVG